MMLDRIRATQRVLRLRQRRQSARSPPVCHPFLAPQQDLAVQPEADRGALERLFPYAPANESAARDDVSAHRLGISGGGAAKRQVRQSHAIRFAPPTNLPRSQSYGLSPIAQ